MNPERLNTPSRSMAHNQRTKRTTYRDFQQTSFLEAWLLWKHTTDKTMTHSRNKIETAFQLVSQLLNLKSCVLVALDGHGGAGKSTIASSLANRFDARLCTMMISIESWMRTRDLTLMFLRGHATILIGKG